MPSPPNGYNQGVMVRQLEAVFEHGVLRPLEPLSLGESQRVRLTLDDQPFPQNGTTPLQEPAPINEIGRASCRERVCLAV